MKRLDYQIVTEDTSRHIGGTIRYFVIVTPINVSGVCKEFATREEAEAWIKEQKNGCD